MDLVGLRFEGVMSLDRESDFRTDWLSGIGATTTDDVLGLVVLWALRVLCVDVIVSTAFQSSSLSSVRPWFVMAAWDTQCWSGVSGGRRAVAI